jgi:hypothetical protein
MPLRLMPHVFPPPGGCCSCTGTVVASSAVASSAAMQRLACVCVCVPEASCEWQDDTYEMPEMDVPDDEGDVSAAVDVKGEEAEGDETMADQSGGFAPAAAKEKNKSGVNKLQEVDDWRAMRDAAAQEAAEEAEIEDNAEAVAKLAEGAANVASGALGVPVEEDGSLNMFWVDAYEDASKPGRIYMFGKVRAGEGKGSAAFSSCCLQIDNVQRQVFILPRDKILDAEGEETEHEPTAVNAKPKEEDLHVSDFAKKMMQKMGHKEGHGLGKDSAGITAPIDASSRDQRTRSGLGHGSNDVSMMDHVFPEFSKIAKERGIKKHQKQADATCLHVQLPGHKHSCGCGVPQGGVFSRVSCVPCRLGRPLILASARDIAVLPRTLLAQA